MFQMAGLQFAIFMIEVKHKVFNNLCMWVCKIEQLLHHMQKIPK